MQTLLQVRKVDHEEEFVRNWENEERYKREFLSVIQKLLDEEDAQTKSYSQQLTANLRESQAKPRKELLEEYEKEFLNRLAVRSKDRAEMRKKADEIVAKRLSNL